MRRSGKKYDDDVNYGGSTRRQVLSYGAIGALTAVGLRTASGGYSTRALAQEGLKIPSPPADVELTGEYYPFSEPVFPEDVSQNWEENAEERELIEIEEITNEPILTDELQEEALNVALESEQVQELLVHNRFETIGATLRPRGEKDTERIEMIIAAVFYDYDQNLVVEAALDYDSLEVIEAKRAAYQPPPTEGELEEAAELALTDERLPGAEIVDAELEAGAILTCLQPNNVDDEDNDVACGERVLDIRFGRFRDPLPEYYAQVDISTRTVLDAGSLDELGCSCASPEDEDRSGVNHG